MDERPNVLIVAADDSLSRRLEAEGFVSARYTATAGGIDLVVVDIGIVDGLHLCEAIRTESSVPIVVVATEASGADCVRALELGADDVVAKALSREELVARIRALLRRSGFTQRRTIEIGDLRLDPVARLTYKRGRPLALAPRQFDLLHALMRNAGAVVPRDRLMSDVWDGAWAGSTKTLDVHIAWLRAKIEDDPSTPRYITTLRGIGFRFASPAELADAI
jgi:DNA-binding response OmpR family regulator